MEKDFLDRGYPRTLIRDAIRKANRVDRKELLTYKEKDLSTFKGITAALDYTPLTSKIKQIVTRHWHLVGTFQGARHLPVGVYVKPNLLRMS